MTSASQEYLQKQQQSVAGQQQRQRVQRQNSMTRKRSIPQLVDDKCLPGVRAETTAKCGQSAAAAADRLKEDIA
jgi:hypothetical protein